MYSKKYKLEKLEEFNGHNPIYDGAEGSICYLAYLDEGKRGWFLCDSGLWFEPPHRIHTSVVKSVEYFDDGVILETQNTRFTFRLISE